MGFCFLGHWLLVLWIFGSGPDLPGATSKLPGADSGLAGADSEQPGADSALPGAASELPGDWRRRDSVNGGHCRVLLACFCLPFQQALIILKHGYIASIQGAYPLNVQHIL